MTMQPTTQHQVSWDPTANGWNVETVTIAVGDQGLKTIKKTIANNVRLDVACLLAGRLNAIEERRRAIREPNTADVARHRSAALAGANAHKETFAVNWSI